MNINPLVYFEIRVEDDENVTVGGIIISLFTDYSPVAAQ